MPAPILFLRIQGHDVRNYSVPHAHQPFVTFAGTEGSHVAGYHHTELVFLPQCTSDDKNGRENEVEMEISAGAVADDAEAENVVWVCIAVWAGL